MKHEEIRHKLSEYIDGAVTPQERLAIDEHLKTCTTCSDALAKLQKTIEQVKQIEEVEAPVWLTQKIMANVRAEAEGKKGLFRRLFYPFAVKLPIQAAAVLVLTVTVYYIYSSMHPAEKYTEAPNGRLAKQEAPEELRDAAKHKATEVPAEREKKVAQEPGYKSLDMKYEYEKPAPPVPAAPGAGLVATREEPAASAPEKRAAAGPAKDAASREELPTAAKTTAPTLMMEQASPESGASVQMESKNKSAARAFAPSNTYREMTYREFVASVGVFPYKASADRRKRLLNNYSKLVIGMSKDEVAALLGDPDFADKLQAKEPPFKQMGSEWIYYLLLNDANLTNEKTDQSISIFYGPDGKAHWITPLNIEGLTVKGHPRQK